MIGNMKFLEDGNGTPNVTKIETFEGWIGAFTSASGEYYKKAMTIKESDLTTTMDLTKYDYVICNTRLQSVYTDGAHNLDDFVPSKVNKDTSLLTFCSYATNNDAWVSYLKLEFTGIIIDTKH